MAIVASKRGGLVACSGGPYKTEDGRESIRALTWAQVDEIVALLDRLNPYDREAVKEPILKIESDNRDPKTKEQRQLWCLAISAKRYALFLRDRNGEPVLLRKGVNNGEDGEDRWSEHGLGHLLNPSDPEGDDRSWIAQAWLAIVRRSLGLAAAPLPIADRVAVGQVTVSSPEVLKPLEAFNAGKLYPQQIKPFNFILSSHVAPFGHPGDADPQRFHLIAPHESDPRKWEKLPWMEPVFRGTLSDQRFDCERHPIARAREKLWRRTRRVRVPRRSQVRRCQRRAVREAKPWVADPAPSPNREAAFYWQGVEQA